MGTKGSQTTTTTQAPQPQFAAQYNQLANRAVNLSQQPYQPYTGQLTAPINAQQYGAIDNINALYPQVSGMISGAAQPLTAAQIQQYYNPYQQNVINATEAQFANTNAQQQQQVLGNAVAQGALGGNRTGVAQAALAGQQQTAEAPVIAGLEQQGYTQAYGAAGQQFQQNPLAAAGLLSSTGTNIAGAQFGMGTAEQQTQQNALNAQYQQYLAAMGYPYQNLAFATGEVGGLGSLAGGTGTVTAPPPSLLAQFGGLGIAGLGAYSAYQNAQARGGRVTRQQGGLVPHFASGGGPGNMPYAGGPAYIPTEPLPHGAGPPHPVSSPIPNNSNQILQQATKLAGTFGRSGFRDAAQDAAQDAADTDASFPAVRDGGLVLPQHNRIELKRGGAIRAGLGFSSFVPRRGYQYGGSPEELAAEGVPATFDERFPTQPGLAPADFDARFQGQAPPPDLDGGTIMQPGFEPPTVVSPPVSAPSVPQATPVQTAGVGQEEVPDIVTRGPEATTWQAKARRAAEAEGVDPNIFAGLIHQESGFNPNVRPSSAGAIGIAQFMPKTAAAEGVDPRNPDQSLQGSAHLMRKLLDKYGSYPLALAAYNAGEGRVDQHLSRGTPLPGETQRYVPAVMAFAGQGAQGAAETAGLGTDEGGYTPPPPRGRTSGLTTGQERPSGGKGPFGMNSDMSMALMAAGLGMMASRSPFPGVAIGEGGLAGLGAYGSLQRQHLAEQQLARQNARETELERHQQAAETEATRFHSYEMNKPQVIAHAKDKYGVDHPIIGIPQVNKAGNIVGWKSPSGEVITNDMIQGTKPLPASATPSLPAPTEGTKAEPAMPSSPVQVASAAPIHIPTGMKVAGQDVTPEMVSTTASQPKQYNEKAIGDLDPEDQAMVKAMVKYDMLPSQLAARSPGHADLIRARALMYDPSYQPAMSANVQKAKYDWANGKHGDSVRQFSTAMDHIELLKGIIANLNNQNSNTWNRMANAFKEEFGYTAPTNFDAASRLVAGEIVKATVGNQNALGDRDEIAANFNRNKAPGQQLGVIDTYEGLMAGQLHNLERQYKGATKADDFQTMLSDRARERFYGHGQTLGDVGPKEGERKQFKQGWGVFRDGKWVPE